VVGCLCFWITDMIYTLTFNPSLDYVAQADSVEPGAIHKLTEYSLFPGGKGINVSQILHNLGIDSVAWGFVAGTTGRSLLEMLEDINIETDFIWLNEGMTRINVKLRSEGLSGICETDYNGMGVAISQDKIMELMSKIETLKGGDIVVISGSIPASVSSDLFREILEKIRATGAMFVADVTGEYLKTALECKAFAVKPNEEELSDFFKKDISSPEEAMAAGDLLIGMGAENALISMGDKGAVLCVQNGEHLTMQPPRGVVVNTVGAGDSMVAGFIAGIVSGSSMQEALKLGVCAGSATAFCKGLAQGNDIKRLIDGFVI